MILLPFRRRRIGALLLALGIVAACGDDEAASDPATSAGDTLETVDVAPPPDAGAVLTADAQERRIAEGPVAGVLPTGFPQDLPLPAGASLVDFGAGPLGSRCVFGLATGVDAAAAAARARLTAGGWTVEGGGRSFGARKGSRRIALAVTAAGPHARLTVDYGAP